MKIEKSGKDEGYLQVSEDDYLEEIASGKSEEEALKPGRHKFVRGGFLKRHPNLDRSKAKTTIYIQLGLDPEVLEYFKTLARETGAASYEEPIKQLLLEAMKSRKTESTGARSDPQEALLENPQFIEAVADRVKKKLGKKNSTTKSRRNAA